MIQEQPKNLTPERSLILKSLFLDQSEDKLSSEQREQKKSLLGYWKFLDDLDSNAKLDMANNKSRSQNNLEEDRENAQTMIDRLVQEKIYPIVTVPKEVWQEVWANIEKEGGLSAHSSAYLKGFKKIVGTLGEKPYHMEGRILLQIKCEPGDLEPRLTGSNITYHGVVGYRKNFVPIEKITLLQ